ncbi:MAG TPA: hypothetical protein VHZ50_09625 [Puia sp.]|jgi:hypothetical protein|nr:hypothetical protein [Puia sp.]
MKFKMILSFLLLIGAAKCSAQEGMDTDGLNNLNNVYLYSLKEYCNSLDSSTVKVIYVKREDFIGESWPKEIRGFKIIYLETYKKVIEENGGKITLVGISPLELKEGIFSVGVIPFSASYKKKVLYLTNGGGLSVIFQYDAEKKGLLYKSKKWSGL